VGVKLGFDLVFADEGRRRFETCRAGRQRFAAPFVGLKVRRPGPGSQSG
jgi:hypothetical protein